MHHFSFCLIFFHLLHLTIPLPLCSNFSLYIHRNAISLYFYCILQLGIPNCVSSRLLLVTTKFTRQQTTCEQKQSQNNMQSKAIKLCPNEQKSIISFYSKQRLRLHVCVIKRIRTMCYHIIMNVFQMVRNFLSCIISFFLISSTSLLLSFLFVLCLLKGRVPFLFLPNFNLVARVELP